MQWNAALDDHQILGVMSDEGRGLLRGCYWGEHTRHGVLDIDPGSQYHNSEVLTKLLQEFSLLGLKLVPYQSSERGGWHLYLFFERDVLSKEVETKIKDYLRVRGYEIKGGTLEVFPSGNALRLPLQAGFAWLGPDGKIEVAREELTRDQALALFFNDLHENRSNWDKARAQIESQILSAGNAGEVSAQEHRNAVTVDGLESLFQKGIDWEKWQRGRSYWHLGLTEPSQRHDAIVCVGHYLWYGDESAGLTPLPFPSNKTRRAELITAWLEEKHGGQSEDINRGRWGEVSADIARATAWTKQAQLVPEYEPYRMTDRMIDRLMAVPYLCPDDLKVANERRERGARRKIQEALAEMLRQGEHPTVRSLVKATGCRKETVRRHSDIWRIYAVHPSTLGLSKGLGDYIAGGEGVSVTALLLPGPICSFPDSLVQEVDSFFPEFGGGQVVLGQEGVKPAGIKSRDQGESFQTLSRGDVSLSLSEESELVETEPRSVIFVHDSTLAFGSEKGVTIGEDPPNFSVAPFVSCLAESQPESPQCKAQALRVPAASLTPGPRLSGIQALRHETAGGILISLPVWYSNATICGVSKRAGETSRRRSQTFLGAASGGINTVLDVTNNNFLTTIKTSYSSGKKDKFLLIAETTSIINYPVTVSARAFCAGLPFYTVASEIGVDSCLVTVLGLVKYPKVSNLRLYQGCRQPTSYHLLDFANQRGRGPPPAHRHLV